jgi:site-specific DNA recombinase
VLVEATDRLSRSQSDLFWLSDRFKFDNVKLFTPNGEVTDMQLTFDGHSNADMIRKLAVRVKRGHDGIAREGLIPGRCAYGYDLVAHEPGVKIINRDQAKIIVRVFKEYVSGKSPRQIAADLMRDEIPSPSGTAHWNFQSIVGGAGKKRGLIHNQLYIGVYLKNRFFNVKNPATGKVVARKADPDDLITAQVSHLRIIEQKLWDAAHKLRKARGNKKFGTSGQVQRAVVPRNQHLLAGLLRCAECNGGMIVTASDRNGLKRVACSAAHNRQSCKHAKTYNLDKLTALAIDSMCSHLTDPEVIKEKARAKSIEFARLEKENNGARQAAIKQYDRLDIQIKKLVRALDDEEGDIPKEIMASLRAKEIERRGT